MSKYMPNGWHIAQAYTLQHNEAVEITVAQTLELWHIVVGECYTKQQYVALCIYYNLSRIRIY